MTTYFQFVKNNFQAPSFMPTFDGNSYTVTIIWNISARRYYVMCKTIDGTLIFLVPLVTSETAVALTALEYDEQNSRVVATTADDLELPIGAVFNATILNNEPTGYNGSGLASVLNSNQFTYNLSINPGLCTVFGAVEILVSMTQAYFASTLIYRNGNFEVDP